MLLFRSGEHVGRWCEAWRLQPGESFSVELCWRLARAWFDQNRGEPDWRRRTPDEAEGVFASLGLTSPFWRLKG
jgi:hypothetical protein